MGCVFSVCWSLCGPKPATRLPSKSAHQPLVGPGDVNPYDFRHANSDRDQQMKQGIAKFNLKASKGIKYLVHHKLIEESAESIAEFFLTSKALSRAEIGTYLADPAPFNQEVLQRYLEKMEFAKLDYDQALRKFLLGFRMPGEAQKIDRIMEKFAQRYCTANPDQFPHPDTAYVLAFSLIMLNTDLHNPAVKNKMTKESFISLNRSNSHVPPASEQILSELYDRITREEIQLSPEDTFHGEVATFIAPDMRGWLLKASHSTLSLTSYKRRWFTLTGKCLYYFESPSDKAPRCILPLENLEVRLVNQQEGTFELTSNDPNVLIKAAKRQQDGSIQLQSKHHTYLLKAESPEDAVAWVNVCQREVSRNNYYELITRKKGILLENERRQSRSAPLLPSTPS
eukprot:GILI01025750.1.p1 GENE.GILI01025750.1~~GILI01025750.1.p1  ORF type:complete len:398 (+),score=87.51 GILI01025750.1:134-1327(+)